jgi:uncharacterized paraquat-inducible protein A
MIVFWLVKLLKLGSIINQKGIFSVIKRILFVFILAAVVWTGTAITQEKKLFNADRHKELGLTCGVCHKEEEPKTPASGELCLVCHTSMEAVAERTKDFQLNPHQNHLVDSSDIACTNCHNGHQPDATICERCHAGMKFEKRQAETEQD